MKPRYFLLRDIGVAVRFDSETSPGVVIKGRLYGDDFSMESILAMGAMGDATETDETLMKVLAHPRDCLSK